MNLYLFSLSAFFLSVFLFNESTCQQQAAAASGKQLFPLAVGNYWVYADSIFSEGRLVSVANDTDKIKSASQWNGRKTFVFSDGKEWFVSGDTVYQLGSQRSGVKISSPVMMASEKESTFNSVFGGDVVVQKKVAKLSACPDNRWKASACYQVTDRCDGYAIVGYGVGIIREKIVECSTGKENYTSRTLIDMNLK